MHLVGDGPTGFLVLSGSSGRVEVERCRVLAEAGATAASYRWFGVTVARVPLDSYDPALAALHERCERLVVLGTSRGAEAALLLGARHAEVDAVVAISPTDVVWPSLSTGRPQRSAWTSGGEPLPFVPLDDGWEADSDPPEFVGLYEQSLETYADRVPAARLPVDRVAGEVLLVAGGDDRLWPSLDFAEQLQRRQPRATVFNHPAAGHRVLLPGEAAPPPPPVVPGASRAPDRARGGGLGPHRARLTPR